MHFLRQAPIRRKLTLIIMLTSGVALLLACAGFVAYELATYRGTMIRNLHTLAVVTGHNSAAALVFGDAKAAEQNLGALQAVPSVEQGCLFSADRRVLAQYTRADQNLGRPPKPISDGLSYEGGHVVLYAPVLHKGERVGTIYLRSETKEMRDRLWRYAGIVALVLLVSVLTALALSARLQRVVSEPIQELAATAREVSRHQDYRLRVQKTSGDEIGDLIDAFNEMLTEIQSAEQALRESEEHFRALIENASDIITVIDADNRVRYQSPSAERIMGFRPEEVIGQYALDYVHADDVKGVLSQLLQVAAQPGGAASFEFRFRRKDGAWICLEAKAKNLIGDPNIRGLVVNSRDVTERRRVEERLHEFAAQLEASNRELQDFAYVASHDLQEPLRKIQAFGDRLKTKCAAALSGDGRDYLDRMQNAASRMQTLINDLLTYSRVTTKAQPFAPVDLDRVAREVLSDLEVRVEQSHGSVEIGSLPQIEADALQMRQLLQNLIGNALKFHRPDVPPQVQLEAHANGDGICRLSVRDNGIGFDEKYLPRLFAVFQRLHGRQEYEGTGVGLAICRKIAERHGGSITAQSRPGQGATFIVMLRIQQPKNGGAKS